ncbi:amidase [Burkholderia thailandensis]|uniref:amidase n=1 Tax=Burkholderia thailandensis TaxID=57975 RepID=UPI0022AC6AD0|nr:amidase [Burkholderia thailandensis]MCZ2902085.1 amidase [Burkholderia thailandensis]MDD1481970.1 amidase [Burkholderia thailandensis]MDD1488643.1 amidase [Burkholderia thailandensis]MDD1494911.1 amidase [Burkholderia thailandensis]
MKLSEYADYDAVGLARLIAHGDVSAAELARTAGEAIEAVNPAVNAVVEHWPADAAGPTAAAGSGPLAGVPFLIKDLALPMAGKRMELGSRLAAGLVSPSDSMLMRRLRAAGLVTLGRTATPEMAFSTATESVQFGATRNPWNLALSAGGSSGGAAAAVAAGIVPLAHATDAAGSIRVPAAFTGLFGLKPTRGRISNGPELDEVFAGLGVQGGLSRTVRDSAALLDAMHGTAAGEPYHTSAPAQTFLSEVGRDPGRLRIGLMLEPFDGARAAPAMTQATLDAAGHLEMLGHDIEPITPVLGASWEAFVLATARIWCATLVGWIDGVAAATARPIDGTTLEPSTLAAYRYGKQVTGPDFASALAVRNAVTRSTADWFRRVDVLLSPTMPNLPEAIGDYYIGAQRTDGLQWTERLFRHSPYTPVFNVAGLPAMSVPLFHDEASGLPIGVQFGAGFAQEATLLRLAGQLEQTIPWRRRRPAVWAGSCAT